MLLAILAAFAAAIPLLLAILEAYQKKTAATPEKRDEQIDQSFAGSNEDVGAQLHGLRDRLRRRQDPQ